MKTGLFILVLVFLGLLVACDPDEDLTFVNLSEVDIEVTYAVDGNERPPFILEPGEKEEREGVLFWKGRVLSVTASADRETLLKKDYSFDDLDSLDFKIEIPRGE